jgi:hypothetical protein
MWALAFRHHENRTPTHGYELTREAAMAAFAKVLATGIGPPARPYTSKFAGQSARVANQMARLEGVASGWPGIEIMNPKFMWSRPPRITAPPEPGDEPHLAGMGEDGRAVAFQMLVEPNAGAGLGHDRCERGFADLERITAHVVAVQLDEVEGVPGTRPRHAGGSGYARTMRARCHRTRRLPHR